MAIAKIEITCADCGRTFVHRKECHNRREADSYEAWAASHIDTCPECNRKAKADAARKKLLDTLSTLGITLPELDGVSDKQIAYAVSVRERCLADRPQDIARYHECMQQLADPAARERNEAACAANGVTYEQGLEMLLRRAQLYSVHIALTATSARDILDKIER